MNVQLEMLHDGDNIQLPAEGAYTARIDVGPLDVDGRGTFEDRLDTTATVEVGGVETADELTVSVDSPPQVSRHDGYETAFFGFEDVTDIV